MPDFTAVAVALSEELPLNSNFPYCVICGGDLRDAFDIHEDECGDGICDECFRYRLPRQPSENPPDRFRPQAFGTYLKR